MRGTVAKQLRKQVYGDMPPRTRRYYTTLDAKKEHPLSFPIIRRGTIVADENRTLYQGSKKEYRRLRHGASQK